jgi:flagellar M-ring protein FliF
MAEQEIMMADTPASSRSLTQANIPRGESLRNILNQPAVRKAAPAIALVGTLGLAAMAWSLLSAPAQAPLYQGLAESDKASVADALSTSGIAYEMDASSGSITVAEDEVHKARMILAGQGLPKAAPSGDALLASLPMGSSRAVEGETLRGAREADLARTIEAIDPVKKARIHLATAEPSVFVRDQVAPAASVMLTLQQGRTLSGAQVRAIRHLVASSVPGMNPDQVSIVDQSGELLSRLDGNVDDRNFELQQQMEDRYRQALASMLGPMIGNENFTVEVHADVDSTESQSTRETYPKDDRALRSEQGNITNQSDSQNNAVGIPGALSNQPPPATQVATTPGVGAPITPQQTNGQSEETFARSFDVGREISVTHRPEGSLKRLSVAVGLRDLKGKARTAKEIAAIDQLVKGAVGFDAARGDVVAISSRPFVEVTEPATNFWDAPWFMSLLRQLGAGFVALLVLLFVARPMLKSLKERAAQSKEDQASIEQQLLSATKGGAGAMSPRAVTLEMIEAAPSYEARANLVRAFVRQDSERAALVVRQLMQESAIG